MCTGDFLRKSDSKTEFCSLLAEVSFLPRRERPLLAGKEFCRATNSYTKSFRKSPFEFVRPVCLFVFSISRFPNTQNFERKRERLKLSFSPFVGRLLVGCLPTDARQIFWELFFNFTDRLLSVLFGMLPGTAKNINGSLYTRGYIS